MSVTVVVCATVPEVAVTRIENVPAGVPFGLICWDALPPPHAAKTAAATSNVASSNCGARRRVLAVTLLAHRAIIPSIAARKYVQGQPCAGPCGNLLGSRNERDVVAIESITLAGVLPGVIVVDGENIALAPVGSPDAANVTGFENEPFEGETVMLNVACWPAATVALVEGTPTE